MTSACTSSSSLVGGTAGLALASCRSLPMSKKRRRESSTSSSFLASLSMAARTSSRDGTSGGSELCVASRSGGDVAVGPPRSSPLPGISEDSRAILARGTRAGLLPPPASTAVGCRTAVVSPRGTGAPAGAPTGRASTFLLMTVLIQPWGGPLPVTSRKCNRSPTRSSSSTVEPVAKRTASCGEDISRPRLTKTPPLSAPLTMSQMRGPADPTLSPSSIGLWSPSLEEDAAKARRC
mmetsp:Transcript_87162/g.241683  ORF Transcript_87162/g.241683 Transcript_87162/m.241683 type:complete len:236 (+) Transcript_87162:457-1164(+)